MAPFPSLQRWDDGPLTTCPPVLFLATASQINIDSIDGACKEDLYPACCIVNHDMCMFDGSIKSFAPHVVKELKFRGMERIISQRGYSRNKEFKMMSKLQHQIVKYRMDRVASYLRPQLLDYLEKSFEHYEEKREKREEAYQAVVANMTQEELDAMYAAEEMEDDVSAVGGVVDSVGDLIVTNVSAGDVTAVGDEKRDIELLGDVGVATDLVPWNSARLMDVVTDDETDKVMSVAAEGAGGSSVLNVTEGVVVNTGALQFAKRGDVVDALGLSGCAEGGADMGASPTAEGIVGNAGITGALQGIEDGNARAEGVATVDGTGEVVTGLPLTLPLKEYSLLPAITDLGSESANQQFSTELSLAAENSRYGVGSIRGQDGSSCLAVYVKGGDAQRVLDALELHLSNRKPPVKDMSPSNTRVFVDGERIAKSSILGCDMDSEGVDFIWTLGQVGGAKKRKASLSTYNVELPIGSFGYNIERTSDGKCRVTSASGNNGPF